MAVGIADEAVELMLEDICHGIVVRMSIGDVTRQLMSGGMTLVEDLS